MSDPNDDNDLRLFPILRGESVGVDGEFSGPVFVAKSSDELNRSWDDYDIVALHKDLQEYFSEHPGFIDQLFQQVMVVVTEFGKPISDFAAIAHARERMAVVKAIDATYVLETDMQISVVTRESQGDIYFIE